MFFTAQRNVSRQRQTPIRLLRLASAPWRVLPDFLIIGAQRGGTSSLFRYLGAHPRVVPAINKEIDYFSSRFDHGLVWYRSHFPTKFARLLGSRLQGQSFLTFEATPFYLMDPHAPARAHQLIPDAKLIALLRNPVDRAYSHYLHNRERGHEQLSFEEAIAIEDERHRGEWSRMIEEPSYQSVALRRFSYLARGRYAEQVERWMTHYPASQLLVVRSEDFFTNTSGTYREILDYLGLQPFDPPHFAVFTRPHSQASMEESTRRRLSAYFEPHNGRLSELLRREFGWEDNLTSSD